MSYYSRNHLQDDWDAMSREDDRERQEAQERSDAEIFKAAGDHVAPLLMAAKANFDTQCALAVEIYGHGTPEHAKAIDIAKAGWGVVRRRAWDERNRYFQRAISGEDDEITTLDAEAEAMEVA